MTPYELALLLHYHVRADSPDEYFADTELRCNVIREFLKQNLLAKTEHGDAGYTTTDRAHVFIRFMLDTPLPEQKWTMPDE
jgi:hypothetical protein